ncbi:hypothetical protein ACLOJK_034936 [Asimina triloba]
MDESITIHQWLDPAISVGPPDQLRQWQITEPIQDLGASIGSRLADLHGSSTTTISPSGHGGPTIERHHEGANNSRAWAT